MTKVFTVNKNGKIELTKDELQKLLDDSYWEGYRANTGTYVYTSPSRWWSPWSVTYCSDTVASSSCTDGNHYDGTTLTIDASNIVAGSDSNCGSNQIEISLNNLADAVTAGVFKNEV